MSPVVEIFRFPASSLYEEQVQAMDDALEHIVEVDGWQMSFRGSEVEDNTMGYVIQVWESLDHHINFTRHPNFPKWREIFDKCINHDKPQPPSVLHVPFSPGSSALDQPTLQIMMGRLKDPSARSALDDVIKQTTEELEGLAFGGAVLEDPDLYCMLVGARTVERDNPVGLGSRILQALSQYIDPERRHVWLKRFLPPEQAGQQKEDPSARHVSTGDTSSFL